MDDQIGLHRTGGFDALQDGYDAVRLDAEAIEAGDQGFEIGAIEQGDLGVGLAGVDLETLVSGLNRLGVKPDGIIAILQGIKSAGAMQADLVVQ